MITQSPAYVAAEYRFETKSTIPTYPHTTSGMTRETANALLVYAHALLAVTLDQSPECVAECLSEIVLTAYDRALEHGIALDEVIQAKHRQRMGYDNRSTADVLRHQVTVVPADYLSHPELEKD